MSTSARSIRFDDNCLWVELSDARVLAVPLAWFPRLMNATVEQRAQVQFSSRGLHWQDLDEDISIEGLLAGVGDLTQQHSAAA